MANIQTVLDKAAILLKGNLLVISESKRYQSPLDCCFNIPLAEIKRHVDSSFSGYRIHTMVLGQEIFYICMQATWDLPQELEVFICMSLESVFEHQGSGISRLKKLLDKGFSKTEAAFLQGEYDNLTKGQILLIEGYKDALEDVIEILVNTMCVKLYFEHHGRLLVIADEKNIAKACEDMLPNILMDLLLECTVAIGGEIQNVIDLPVLYENCLDAFRLKAVFRLNDQLLDYEQMYAYRAAMALEPSLKRSLMARIYTNRFKEILDSEMSTTIEAFFQNNLKLTDTAAKLYIHRNTLLYRLEKIYRCTGFDLKKFEDSWLFRLGWLIGKGNCE